jgi:hypothetical protein
MSTCLLQFHLRDISPVFRLAYYILPTPFNTCVGFHRPDGKYRQLYSFDDDQTQRGELCCAILKHKLNNQPNEKLKS